MEVEAAKGVPYRWLIIRAVQLSSEVYSSCGGEGLRCNVLYRRRSLNFQYQHRVSLGMTESKVDMETAKGVPYRRPILWAVQLL